MRKPANDNNPTARRGDNDEPNDNDENLLEIRDEGLQAQARETFCARLALATPRHPASLSKSIPEQRKESAVRSAYLSTAMIPIRTYIASNASSS